MQDRRDIVDNSSIDVVSQYGGMGLPTEVLSLAIPFAFLIGTKALEERKSNESKESKNSKKSNQASSPSSSSKTKSKTSKTSKKQGGAGYSSNPSNPSNPSYPSYSSYPENLLMPNSIVNQAYEMAKSMNLPNTKL